MTVGMRTSLLPENLAKDNLPSSSPNIIPTLNIMGFFSNIYIPKG